MHISQVLARNMETILDIITERLKFREQLQRGGELGKLNKE